MSKASGNALLRVTDLAVQFHLDGTVVRAVDGVSFDVFPGETLGIVGESGSGKSVTNLAIMGLVPRPPAKIVSGSAMYHDLDLLRASPRVLESLRGKKIAMIFQDPMTALNPFLSVADQLTEVTRRHLGQGASESLRGAIEMLERVGIPNASARVHDYPHQFSGGMRQRVMIAMALLCGPDLLIADEPTTALDVTIQAQILELLKELQRERGMAVIFITHALGVVASMCHRVMVMYGGKIVEEATVDELFASPRHPYTLGLLESIPRLDEKARARLLPIAGQPPDLANLPSGCSFHPRCPFAIDRCRDASPALVASEGHRLACHIDLTTQPRHEVASL